MNQPRHLDPAFPAQKQPTETTKPAGRPEKVKELLGDETAKAAPEAGSNPAPDTAG